MSSSNNPNHLGVLGVSEERKSYDTLRGSPRVPKPLQVLFLQLLGQGLPPLEIHDIDGEKESCGWGKACWLLGRIAQPNKTYHRVPSNNKKLACWLLVALHHQLPSVLSNEDNRLAGPSCWLDPAGYWAGLTPPLRRGRVPFGPREDPVLGPGGLPALSVIAPQAPRAIHVVPSLDNGESRSGGRTGVQMDEIFGGRPGHPLVGEGVSPRECRGQVVCISIRTFNSGPGISSHSRKLLSDRG